MKIILLSLLLFIFPFSVYSIDSELKKILTKAEKDWLTSHSSIKVSFTLDWAPYEFLDDNGNFCGYSADYLRYLSEMIGISCEPVIIPSFIDQLDSLKSNKIDLLSSVFITEERKKFMCFTNKHLTLSQVLVTTHKHTDYHKVSDLTGIKVGFMRGWAIQEIFKKNYPQIPQVCTDSVQVLVGNLLFGNTKALVIDVGTLSYWANKLNISNLRVAFDTKHNLDMAIGFNKNNPILRDIFMKAAVVANKRELQKIKDKWFEIENDPYLKLKKILAILGIISIIAGILFYIWIWQLKKIVNRKTNDLQIQLRINKEQNEELEKHKNKLEVLVDERTQKISHLIKELSATNEELMATNESLLEQKKELELVFKILKNTQGQLIQSEKMAALGVLISGVAHEINNPVNYISSGVNALESSLILLKNGLEHYQNCASIEDLLNLNNNEDGQKLKYYLSNIEPIIKNIKKGVDRTTQIVKSLYFYAHSDDKISPANISILIDHTLELLYHLYKNKITITKNYNFNEDFFCNTGQISQLILNVLINAIQSIENNGEIIISTNKEDEKLSISIKDTGCGIEPKIIDKIFDPFFTTKSPGKGTGLGLYLVYEIVSRHFGEIKIDSTPGIGTEFKILLPLKTH